MKNQDVKKLRKRLKQKAKSKDLILKELEKEERGIKQSNSNNR